MNILLAVGSIVVSLVVLEGALALSLSHLDAYYPWRPNMEVILHPAEEYLPGIQGTSRFLTNSDGIRADERSSNNTDRILVVGGSTTECLYLDQQETWAHLLQEDLGGGVWVGNAGKSGISTKQYILHIRHLLEQIEEISTIILLTGVNDFAVRLADGDEFVPDLQPVRSSAEHLSTAFDVLPRYSDDSLPRIKRTRTWFLLTKLKYLLLGWSEVQDKVGKNIHRARMLRQEAQVIHDAMPDLSSALEQYRVRLHQLVDEAHKHNVRLIMLTQPSMWRADLSDEEQALLWFGWMSGAWKNHEYYSAEALADGIARFNNVTLDVCKERTVECIDLASLLPKDTSIFYDDVHFHEEGARRIAEILVDFFQHEEGSATAL